jgi:DNA-binding transcriptional MerR regulator
MSQRGARQGDRTWSISELAAEFDVTARALRFYEDKGLLAPLRVGQARLYTSRDRARLALVLRGKRLGFPLDEIRQMLDLYDLRDGERVQMRVALEACRSRLGSLARQRQDIDAALEEVSGYVTWLEDRLRAPAVAQGASAAGNAKDVE